MRATEEETDLEEGPEAPKRKRFEGLEPSLETQRKQMVLNAVVESIREDGFDRMTMRRVAERAGVSTGMLVYYFGSKKEMVNAAFAYASQIFTGRLDANTASSFGARRLRLLLESVALDQKQAEPHTNRFILQVMAAAANDPALQADQRRMVPQGRDRIERSVRAAIEAGEFRADIDPKVAADLIYGLWMGWIAETGAYPDVITPEEMEALAGLVFRLLSREASAEAGETSEAPSAASTPERIAALLAADTRLSPKVAASLAGAIRDLYDVATIGAEEGS